MKLLLIGLCALSTITTHLHAIPLRELIYQMMDSEHQGVLTQAEINYARRLGAAYYRAHTSSDYPESIATKLANNMFPKNIQKQNEWKLEYMIGWHMANEAALWTP